MYISAPYACSACGGQKKVLYVLKLSLVFFHFNTFYCVGNRNCSEWGVDLCATLSSSQRGASLCIPICGSRGATDINNDHGWLQQDCGPWQQPRPRNPHGLGWEAGPLTPARSSLLSSLQIHLSTQDINHFKLHHILSHHNKPHLPSTLRVVFSPPDRCQKTPGLHMDLCLLLSFTGSGPVPVFSSRPGMNIPEPVCGSLSAIQSYGHWVGTEVLSCRVDTESQTQDLWINRKCF